ncbi:hypothetical protein MRB53_037145 [Persea americana]|nr:hypothetical protein MRB53_037145 [Persea americana]
MPRAEVGSTKHVANQMKSKGLQRLRWFCQVCEKQCRDENGFKCHVASESHVRQMLIVGANPNKAINDYTRQFQSDFLKLLRTGHGTKSVHVNHFYQEYISDKLHTHLNATRFKSLTEFAKHLGREGICRVEETDKGLHIAWIDNSPEALRRQDAIRKRERMDKGDEEREQRLIEEQVERAHESRLEDEDDEARALQRTEGEKITLNFGSKPTTTRPLTPPTSGSEGQSPRKNRQSLPDEPGWQLGCCTVSESSKNVVRLGREQAQERPLRRSPLLSRIRRQPW